MIGQWLEVRRNNEAEMAGASPAFPMKATT
jgi:hypothetical protein